MHRLLPVRNQHPVQPITPRPSLTTMADLVQLAQIRAQGDSKLLKKAIKDLYKLASGIQGDEL